MKTSQRITAAALALFATSSLANDLTATINALQVNVADNQREMTSWTATKSIDSHQIKNKWTWGHLG